jgi:outer membrane protein assembly factor BamD (BamD/ComL family)
MKFSKTKQNKTKQNKTKQKVFFSKVVIIMFLGVLNSFCWGETTENYLDTGKQALESGDYGKATTALIQAYETSTAGSQAKEESQFYLIKAYLKCGDSTQALQTYQALLQRNPQSPALDDLQYLLGKWFYDQSNLTEAQKYLTTLTSHYEDSPYRAKGYLYLMWIGYRNEDTSLLDSSFNSILKEYPGSPDEATAYCEKARFNIKKEEYLSAESTYQKVLKDYPLYRWGKAEAYKGLSEIRMQQGHYDEALTYISNIRNLGINDKWNQQCDDMEVYCYTLKKEYPVAISKLQQMISVSTSSSELQSQYLFKLGNLYLKNNQPEQAKSKFQQAITKNPSSNWASLSKERLKVIKNVQERGE